MHFALSMECTFLPPGITTFLLEKACQRGTPPAVNLATGVLYGLRVLTKEVVHSLSVPLLAFSGGGGIFRVYPLISEFDRGVLGQNSHPL